MFLCILRYHCRRGLLQQYEQLLEDMVGPGEARAIQMDRTRIQNALTGDRNFSISCELGVCYPSLRAMLNREDLHLRMSVSSASTNILFNFNVYIVNILYKNNVYNRYILSIII